MTADETAARVTPGRAYAFHAEDGAQFWDYVRAITCLALVFGVFALTAAGTMGWWISGALLIIFGGYLANTLYRHGLRLEMDDSGLTVGWRNPWDPAGLILAGKRRLPWDGLQSFSVRYFSRDKLSRNGWTMVRLVGLREGGRALTITFDGAHEGFKPVLQAALDTARRRGLVIDEATLANLEILGFAVTEDDPWTS